MQRCRALSKAESVIELGNKGIVEINDDGNKKRIDHADAVI